MSVKLLAILLISLSTGCLNMSVHITRSTTFFFEASLGIFFQEEKIVGLKQYFTSHLSTEQFSYRIEPI
jgi:hypothetical protein